MKLHMSRISRTSRTPPIGRAVPAVLLVLLAGSAAATRPAGAQDPELYPAGSINACLGKQKTAVIFEDLPEVAAQARGIVSRFFTGAQLLTDARALETDLHGRDLIFYGTWDSGWLATFRDRLPFRFVEGRVELQERSFEGEHPRVICGLRNPVDPDRRLVLYVAGRAADIPGINEVFHGPTEWLVADGRRTLGTGNFSVDLSPEQMQSDLKRLTDLIESVHPACLEGLPPLVQQAAEQASEKTGEPLERSAFTFLVNDVLLALHDAHSTASIDLAGPRVALPLRWLQEGLAAGEDAGELRLGDQIVSLGGLGPDELMAGLRGLVPAENDWWIRARAEQMLQNVAVLEHLGVATRPELKARVLRDGQVLSVSIGEPAGSPSRERPPEWVRFELFPEHSLGLFTLDQCRADETFKSTLRRFFEAVAEAGLARVAVDLRRNGGGNSSVCDEFLRYLDIDEFRTFSAEVRISTESLEQQGLSSALGYFRNPPKARQNDRVTDLPPFAGELYVLTSNRTFSSGSWFSVVVQDNGLGEVLGEPTGNAPSSYGDILHFSLPESGVSFTLSFKKFVRPAPKRDPAMTLTPDVELPVTLEDLQSGTDPVLGYLRRK